MTCPALAGGVPLSGTKAISVHGPAGRTTRQDPLTWKGLQQAEPLPARKSGGASRKRQMRSRPGRRCSWEARPTAPLWLINHNAG
jgi:hypothetical protein